VASSGGKRIVAVPGSRLLDTPFKGTRGYLHSTDIYPALTEMANDEFGPQSFVESLTLRRPFTKSILATFEPLSAANGSFRVRHNSGCTQGCLIETETPITRRNPVDLPAISASIVSGPGFARIQEPTRAYANLDVAVSLMKYLADRVEQRHWWLCQINFDTPLTGYPLEVRIRQNLGGICIIFEVVEETTVIGSVRFMVENANC
jgi:hypothetical protein